MLQCVASVSLSVCLSVVVVVVVVVIVVCTECIVAKRCVLKQKYY